jgi:hypothetical protein
MSILNTAFRESCYVFWEILKEKENDGKDPILRHLKVGPSISISC